MYKYGIVGDVHIDTKVTSRKDDYFLTCLDKIKEVADNCQNVIFLGDIFNRQTIPFEYFSRLYTHLMYLKNKNKNTFWTIIGNHDIYNENEQSVNKTALGLCNKTGIINIIEPQGTRILDYTFYTSYVNLENCKDHLKTMKLNNDDILLVHHYFEDTFPGLCYEDIKNIGCSHLFCGHEHTPFPYFVKSYPEFKAYRCGSLLRNAATPVNLTRKIYYFAFNTLDSIDIIQLKTVEDAKDVFTDTAYNQENLKKKKFNKSIEEVINKYTSNISTEDKFSLRTVLKELKAPEDCLEYIATKYTIIGEVFN